MERQMRTSVIVFVIATLMTVVLFSGITTQPVQASRQPTIPIGQFLSADGRLHLPSNKSGTLDFSGYDVRLDPNLGPVFRPLRKMPAFDSTPVLDTWLPMPNDGFGAYVSTFALNGDDLYVGGGFSPGTVDGSVTGLNAIARYNTSTGTWSALPHNGLSGRVVTMAFKGSDLYIGGAWFSQTSDGAVTGLNNMAIFNTETNTWSALPNNGLGVEGDEVRTMTFIGDDLYVGGYFTKTNDGEITLNYIARLDTSTTPSTWHALPNNGLTGINHYVNFLVAVGGDLYVGGMFDGTADSSISLHYIARLDTSTNPATWHALPNSGLNDEVDSMVSNGTDLYLGGLFTSTYDGSVTDLNSVARFDTTDGTWSALANKGLIRRVSQSEWWVAYVASLVFSGSDLYVGGFFTHTFDLNVTNLNGIARYDTTTDTWYAAPHTGLADNTYQGEVRAFLSDQNTLFVGGSFQNTYDGAIKLNHIAQLVQNLAPIDISLSKSNVDGAQVTGIPVGTFTTTDPNVGDLFTYSFCGGADDSSFKIGGNTLKTAIVLDYWKKKSHNICIRTTDAGSLTFDKNFSIAINPTFKSAGAYDGWVLESTETSNRGGTINVSGGDLMLGDDIANRQYRSILSINTAKIPNNAIITRATLQIRYHKQVGPNAFLALGKIIVDIRKGSFSNNAVLKASDFQAAASKAGIGSLRVILRNSRDWYYLNLSPTVFRYINKAGITQFRLRFQKDDNNDHMVNALAFCSGNASDFSRPVLIVEYHLP
jgi:hypothetical protein